MQWCSPKPKPKCVLAARPGSKVFGAAHREGSRSAAPNTFDPGRAAKTHFGFGFGLHHCIGIHLARLETGIWLDRLLERLPVWDVAEVIDYGSNFVLRGPLAVPERRG